MAEEGVVNINNPKYNTQPKIYIKNITISSFKSLRNFSIELEDDITILIGLNGSGKTTILEAISNITYADKSIWNEEYYNKVSALSNMRSNPCEFFINFSIKVIDRKTYFASMSSSHRGFINELRISNIKNKSDTNLQYIEPETLEGGKLTIGRLVGHYDSRTIEKFREIEKHIPEIFYIPSNIDISDEAFLIGDYSNTAYRYLNLAMSMMPDYEGDYSIRAMHLKDAIEESVKILCAGNINIKLNITYEPFMGKNKNPSYKIAVEIDGVKSTIGKLSSGQKWILYTAILISFLSIKTYKNNIILMDEPAKDIQYDLLQSIRQGIHSLSNDFQIVYSTHNPSLIEQAKLNSIRIIKNDSGRIYSISPSKYDMKEETKELLPLFYAKRNELLLTIADNRTILITEGSSDYNYINMIKNYSRKRPEIASKIRIVDAGGISEIPSILRLIPDEINFIVLTDIDKERTSLNKIINILSEKNKGDRLIHPNNEKICSIEDLFDRNEYLRLVEKCIPGIDVSRIDENITLAKGIDKLIKDQNISSCKHHGELGILMYQNASENDLTITINNFNILFDKILSMSKTDSEIKIEE